MSVAGLRGTGDWGTDQRPKDFRETILFRNPNGSAPLTALMARMSKESVTDPEFSWWDEPNDIIRLTVSGSHTTSDSTIAVKGGDPSSSNPLNRYGDADNLKPGDVMLVEHFSDPANEPSNYGNMEVAVVEEVISATNVKVQRGAAGTTAQSLADGDFLQKIGSVYGEGTPSPKAVSRNPIKYNNFCQIFKTPYELTTTARLTKTRTGDPWKNDKQRKMKDHSKDLEHAFMFGKKHEGTDTNGKPLRFTGGIRDFIPSSRTTIKSTAYSNMRGFLDDVFEVFDFDSDAGDERIAFAGNKAMNALSKAAESSSDVNFTEVVDVYGMRLRRFEMPQGTLFLKTHPLLNRNHNYDSSMWIIDPSAIRYRFLRDTKSEDDIQLPDEDVRKGQWMTEAGLEVRHGGVTMKYIGNISFA